MTIQSLRQALLGGIFLIAICTTPQAIAEVPIKINAWAIHQGVQIVYRYQIENNSASIIDAVKLGLSSPGKELPGLPWSLTTSYFDGPVPLDTAHCKPFHYMDCTISVFQFDYMAEPKTRISMRGIENNLIPPPKFYSGAENIRPGTRSSVAELTIPAAYQSSGYLTSFGEVSLLDNNTRNPDGTIVTDAVIQFTQVDVTPPTLSFSLNPGILWPPNNQPTAIHATIAVQDDYDPAPEIKLESITSNEALAADDIQSAQLGADDRNFYLAAKRAGNNMAGRIYTVTYSATDASGNKATASATVTVPHDQGK